MKILNIIPRIYIQEFSQNVEFYNALLESEPKSVFKMGASNIARYDNLLLVAGTDEDIKNVSATIVVDSISKAKEIIQNSGGQIILEPSKVPSGIKMIVKHPDGNSFEYIEPNSK